jgi:hypothetical protein
MQALWSRTGLSHRCACRACEQVLGAGRRATTKASRRKATFAEAFTALYSSFLATAAVVEAVRKEDRKAKVDAELEAVRNELSELRAKRALRELQAGIADQRLPGDDIPLSDLTDLQNRALWEQWRQIYDSEGFLDNVWRANGTAEETLSSNQNHVKPFGGVRLEATTILRAECTRIMRHIQAEEVDVRIDQKPLTTLDDFENAASRLRSYIKGMLVMADRLHEERKMPRSSHGHYSKNHDQYRRQPWLVGDRRQRKHIKSRWPPAHGAAEPVVTALSQAWQAFDAPVPEYWFQKHPLQRENTIRLNDEIRELFRDDELPLDELLGHISLRILKSPSLPDVHTHNLLLAGFTRRRWFNLASQAYELFFSDTNTLYSTPASLALSVTKPAMFWDVAGFKRAAGAIIGRDPTVGAKIARWPLAEVTRDGFVLSWATDYARRGVAGHWINAYAPMDLALREALISSLLHLRQHIDAASFFLACLQTGASVAAGVVFELFNAIAKTPDARSAVRLVRGLAVRSKKFGELLRSLPKDIRLCVCRRLDYLLHIINLRQLDTEYADDAILDLGMCRRQLANLLDVLEEHDYSNRAMNRGRSTFDMHKEGFRAVSSSQPLGLRTRLSTAPATSQVPLKGVIEQWAPDVDGTQVALWIQEQIRNTVHAEVEKKLQEQGQDTVKLQVEAHLRRQVQDNELKPAGSADVQTKDALEEQTARGSTKPMSDGEEEALRRKIEKDIEETVRVQIRQQVEKHVGPLRKSFADPREAKGPWAVPRSGRWLRKLSEPREDAEEWPLELKAGTGS